MIYCILAKHYPTPEQIDLPLFVHRPPGKSIIGQMKSTIESLERHWLRQQYFLNIHGVSVMTEKDVAKYGRIWPRKKTVQISTDDEINIVLIKSKFLEL